MKHAHQVATAALVGTAAVWGSTFVIVQDAIAMVPPLQFVGIRFGLAALCLLPFVHQHLRTMQIWKDGALLGLAICAGFSLQTWGLTDTTASRAAFLTGCSVIMVPFLMISVLRRAPRMQAWLAMMIAVFGLWLFTGATFESWTQGDSAVLGCALAFAFQIVLLDKRSKKYSPFALLCITCLVVSLIASGLGFGLEGNGQWDHKSVWVALFVTTVLATIGAFGAQHWAQRYISPARTALIFLLEPVFAAITSAGLGRETFSTTTVIGGVFILFAMAMGELQGLFSFVRGSGRAP